jgi:phage shock protein A
MRFLERMTLLVKADAHGVMDQLEERSLLMKQHLREAEIELSGKRVRLQALEEEEVRVADEARRREARALDLDRDVELALSRGEDELARFALRRLLPERDLLRRARERATRLERSRVRLQEQLGSQEAELEELRRRVRARLSCEREAPDERDGAEVAGVAEEEVELELLRRRPPECGGRPEEV